MTEENFDRLYNVHFKGVYFLTQKLLPLIADGGRIVCTSSGLARFAIPGYSAYGAMKGAIEVLARYLADQVRAALAERGVENLSALQLEVEESPGQTAVYRLDLAAGEQS